MALVVKNLPANAGNARDMNLIPGLGRSPEGGHGNPLHYSCLENPHGKRSLVGYSTWDSKELKMTKQITTAQWRLILSIFSQVFWLFVYLAWCSCSVTQLCPMLWDSVNCSTPVFSVLHHLPKLAQTHVHWVSDTIPPSISPISIPRCEELTHWKRPCCWERRKAEGKEGDRGWDGWMVSLTWWTWVWVSSGGFWWTGRPGVLQSMGSQRVGHDLSD